MQTLGDISSASDVPGSDAFTKIHNLNTKANNVTAGKLQLTEGNGGSQFDPNTEYTFEDMNGIYLVFLTRSGTLSNDGIYLTQCHTSGDNAIVPIYPISASGFSISFSGTSLVINSGNAQPRIRFMRLSTANY